MSTVPVPKNAFGKSGQEHDSGGFAVNGEMSEEHWTAQMVLYRELYPELRHVAQDEILPRVFVADALKRSAATRVASTKPDQIPAVAFIRLR